VAAVLPISGFMNLVHKTRNCSQLLLPAARCPQRPARPMIVKMTQEPLPTAKKRRITNTAFRFTDGKSGENMFFRWMSTGEVQLNDILFGRILMGIHCKFPQGNNKNVLSWKTHCNNIKTKKNLNLGVFWHSLERFLENGKDFTKKKNNKFEESLAARCLVNKHNWKCHVGGDMDLFSYPKSVELLMDSHLSSEDRWRDAVLHAQEGFVTENFLHWLIGMKHHCNEGEPKDPLEKQKFIERAHLIFLHQTNLTAFHF
jgi:hypothetical protein